MSWDSTLRGRLLGDATIAATIGSEAGVASIDWDVRRPNAPLPGIVLQVISDGRPQNHDGFDGVWWSRVQLRTQALDRATATALREAAIATLVEPGEFASDSGVTTFMRGFVDAVRGATVQSETRTVFGELTDFILWHTE